MPENYCPLADVQRARAATVGILRLSAEMGISMNEACQWARKYLKQRGYPVPDDPLAFASGGRITMRDGDLRSQFVVEPNGEVI